MIYITSFKQSNILPDEIKRFSVAVYQPKGYDFPKVDWADIRDENGEWIRPRRYLNAQNPRRAYLDALMAHYEARSLEASAWVSGLDGSVALCCWCPYERAAIRQMNQWGSFICHTAVIGEFLAARFNIPIWYDSDRLFMTVLTQRFETNENS